MKEERVSRIVLTAAVILIFAFTFWPDNESGEDNRHPLVVDIYEDSSQTLPLPQPPPNQDTMTMPAVPKKKKRTPQQRRKRTLASRKATAVTFYRPFQSENGDTSAYFLLTRKKEQVDITFGVNRPCSVVVDKSDVFQININLNKDSLRIQQK